MSYIDKKRRPLHSVLLQLTFGLLVYIGLASGGRGVVERLAKASRTNAVLDVL